MVDVVVVGAGLAGLVAAQQLQKARYSVVVVEKSRGLGGRVATRRLQGNCADHGVCYLEAQGDRSQQLITTLLAQEVIQPWADQIYELDEQGFLGAGAEHHPRYGAADGMTAITKFLATGLEIWRGQRVTAIRPQSDQTWALSLEAVETDQASELTARAIVMAIPAPQALVLVEPLVARGLPPEFLASLRSVEFDPCLTAIAVYSGDRQQELANLNLPWRAVMFSNHAELAWVGLDSSKRPNARQPVFVLQSSATFARQHLEETNLQAIGQQLLQSAAQALIPWLTVSESLQVHRWRYAFVAHPWQATHLVTANPLPLVCSGDWCGGSQIEAALTSGADAAAQINTQLASRVMPDLIFSRFGSLA
jgi:renalase